MTDYLVREIEAADNVWVRPNTRVTGGGVQGRLEYLTLECTDPDHAETLRAAALFVLIGAEPRTKWLSEEIQRDGKGFVVTAQDLDDLYADMEERGVGERTARYVHQVTSSALERAARKHLIPFNVARYADPPPMPEGGEQLALTLDELSRFFEAAAGTRFENYFVLSALCGARPQEILGLKWSDVDLPKEPGIPGEATIRRRVSVDGSGRWDILDGTKTSRKNRRAKARSVYLMPEAVEALRKEHKTYLDKHTRLVERWEETWREHPEVRDLIFPSETGGPMNRNNLHRRHFKPLARKAGLPDAARLYTLRHTFATLWMESNEPVKVLQEILGHSRIDQTMNTYAHVMPHIQADAFGRFSRRFSQR